MERALIIQKVIAFGLVIPAVFLLNAKQITMAFIALGQGHFIAAYYYQWRAGKITERGFSLFFVSALLLLGIAFMTQAFEIIAFVTLVVFLIHHFQDEVLLFGKERSLGRTLEQLGPVCMYAALTGDAVFGTSVSYAVGFLVLSLFAVYTTLLAQKKYSLDALGVYLWAIAGVLVAIALTQTRLDVSILNGTLILFHYVCWYIHFYFRFQNNKERLRSYIRDMVVINILVLAAFFSYVYFADVQILLVWFFAPIYFYIWTILHILSSVRTSDYAQFLRWH